MAQPSGKAPTPSTPRIFGTPFSKVYLLYVQKAERKGRTKDEVDRVIGWLTGYSPIALTRQIEQAVDFETFFEQAPPVADTRCALVTGVVCGVRVEAVDDPLMRKIRCLDKLIDELAQGKALDKILRS